MSDHHQVHISNELEALESRRLLSVSLDDDGRLRVNGDNGDNEITFDRVGGTLIVNEDGRERAFDASDITFIDVDGNGGNDVIDLRDGRIRADVEAGAGDDTILGSAGRDTLEGDAGRDLIKGFKGNDKLEGSEGRDTVRGGVGNDKIEGGEDRDFLFGDAGNDVLESDEDGFRDFVSGGPGTDRAEVDNGTIDDEVDGVEVVDD